MYEKSIFHLDHYWETDYDRDFLKPLGYFTSKMKILEVIERYKKLPGFQDKKDISDSEVDSYYPDHFAGFSFGEKKMNTNHMSKGYITYAYTCSEESKTFIDDMPSFVMNESQLKKYQEDPAVTAVKQKKIVPYPKSEKGYYVEIPFLANKETLKEQESPTTFAHRVMQQQGIHIYPTGPESEFWNLKRWAIAMHEEWEKTPYELAKREFSLEEDESYYKKLFLAYKPSENFIYLLYHYDHQTDSITPIGSFASYTKAKEQIPIYQTYLGFKDIPDGFYIDPYQVDHAYWATGYATKVFK